MFSFVRNQRTSAPLCLPPSRGRESLLLRASPAFGNVSVPVWAVLIAAQWGLIRWGFPGGSACKAPAYNAGDPGSIQGLGRSPREGNGNPLQYSGLERIPCSVHGVAELGMTTFDRVHRMMLPGKLDFTYVNYISINLPWASLVAQTVKNLSAMQETRV